MRPNRIAVLRETANLSKADLAWRMNISERTVYRWEAGVVEIGDEQKLALSSLFNVQVGYLIGWDQAVPLFDSPPPAPDGRPGMFDEAA
jgi:DNA-binding XRE family transcriptional regulator